MERTDPHKTYNYSYDQIIQKAFEIELSTINLRFGVHDEGKSLVEQYLKERVNEIKERWK